MFRERSSSKLFVLFTLIAALLLAGCSGGASGSTSPVEVQVKLTEFQITSSLTTFTVGVPYHFIVTNSGTVAHEFQIMPPASGQLTQDQIQKMSLAGLSKDDLPAGATKELDYTFTQAYAQGALELACHLPGHYEAGMHISIVVNK